MKYEKKHFENITLVCADTLNYGKAIFALQKCLQQATFKSCKFLTNTNIKVEGIETVIIPNIPDTIAYSKFIVYELYKYFDTAFVWVVQYDGYILDITAWDDAFLNYDAIGAKWLYKDGRNTFNGGFSIRSERLQTILGVDKKIEIYEPEDEITGRLYRRYLEQDYNIKFAPEELCDKFSFELNEPTKKTVGFHGYFHEPFKEHIIIKRSGAMGDIVMFEPVMNYFASHNYQVVLDIPIQFMALFGWEGYLVKHISEMNKNITPYKVVDLEMAYEIKPQQSVLKSFYEVAGIDDGKMRNSILQCNQTQEQRLFEKYALIHIDDTGMPYRNQYGIEWKKVVSYLEQQGFTVLQIGKRMKEKVATYFNTVTIQMLMYLIKGADLFIGIDSGNAQIAVAFDVPTVIFSGSVDLRLRYSNFDKIQVVHTDCPTSPNRFCYHEIQSTVGKECEFNKAMPPCCTYSKESVINAINKRTYFTC